MHKVILFAEDYGHETFIRALLERLAHEHNTEIAILNRSVRRGHGKVISEFQAFLKDLNRGKEEMPDLLVVATDANCKGYGDRKREIDEVSDKFKQLMVCAIPDPHIERWLLLDSAAFKSIFGRGCKAPDQKCERDRYKRLLSEAVQAAGVVPPLGGIEYAEDIVTAMDLGKLEKANASLGRFLKDLRNVFRQWSQV
ncbi:MAG TPA: DUF4276 family protein [Syntrophales bacterium]|mgnify:CR=1 FL=1|nr:DUF4276 family protein [Syntrophales bacterium]HOM08136.1 DUF4276 family protein [Syntrophales bacterium]HPC33636.1 DUF4276 family protein [Syntrophales bacterium]HRR48247.1 DUF4276 family protein [Syntrophales bacterium]